ALSPRTALIEYVLLHDAVAIFYATHDRVGVEIVPVNGTALRRLTDHFADLLQRRSDTVLIERDAAELHRLLIAPVAQQIASTVELVIVPDRELNSVPFAALYDAKTRRFLIDDFTINLAPNASFLRRRLPPLV